ncbi:hypothetical protein GU243_02440 [Pseudarthrobacter psychrotolerans]|uniref:Uncharacterized protein n=1 Tax=Pseudarthrobacter psychrotolerans TaxID=2697569 RepID=A0A6P1NMP8_9MICC|nr:hypothetical protein [Pseudarthrobacter psychrotolerans]QHK18822.1 hypothetical protein GU243_02440 [Pseudarthrobacter psychrotolerans]
MSGRTYTEADMAAAWESGYWRGTSHTGPLNDAAVRAKNPHRAEGVTPAKACKVALKTEKDRDASPKSVTAEESNL